MSSLEVFMLEDKFLNMDYTKYGILISSFSYSTLFMPLFGGRYIDLYGHRTSLLLFLFLSNLSMTLFIISIHKHYSFFFTLFATFLFGCAHGNIVVTTRAVISKYFHEKEIAFGLGCTVGITCIGKMGARALVAPVALATGNYINSFLVCLVVCMISWLMGWIYVVLSRRQSIGRTPTWKGAINNIGGGGENIEELILEEGKEGWGGEAKETQSLLGLEGGELGDKSPGCSSSFEEDAKVIHRIESLINIRRIVTYGQGIEGMGGSEGPVAAEVENGQGEDGDILKHLKRDRINSLGQDPGGVSGANSSSSSTQVTPNLSACDPCPSAPSSSNLTLSFWLLSILHALFLMVFHLFPNISGHFLYSKWGYNPAKAGYISSLLSAFAIVGAPITGFIIDRTGGQLYVVLLSSILSLVAYYLLTYTTVEPVIGVLMLSAAESTVPTIIMALIPLSTSREMYGRAFGIAEVFDAFGSIIGNVIIGYIRDRSPDYTRCMEAILALNLICVGLTVVLIRHNERMEGGRRGVLNEAWHSIMLRQKGRGKGVERGRQIKGVKIKRERKIRKKYHGGGS